MDTTELIGPASIFDGGFIVGEIRSFGSGAPTFISLLREAGWLICDGGSHLVSDHPRLARVLESSWGSNPGNSGPGGPRFCVPNLCGQFLRGWDSAPTPTDPDRDQRTDFGGTRTIGNEVGSYQPDAVVQHGHGIPLTIGVHVYAMVTPGFQGEQGHPRDAEWSWERRETEHFGSSGETRPKNAYVLFCVYAGQPIK